MVNVNERDQNEFNMAFGYLGRLNTLFFTCDEAAISLDAYKWYHSLSTLFRELSTEMKQEEIEKLSDELWQLSPKIQESVQRSLRVGRNQIDNETYKALHNFEMRLRKITKESGLQNKMKSDPRFSLQ